MAAEEAVPERVPVGHLIHDHKRVLKLVEDGHRIKITRHGQVIAVITPPDPSESALDELAAAGHVPKNWRELHASQQQFLDELLTHPLPPGPPVATEALLADRAESDR